VNVVAVNRDITQLKQAEEALKKVKRNIESFLEQCHKELHTKMLMGILLMLIRRQNEYLGCLLIEAVDNKKGGSQLFYFQY